MRHDAKIVTVFGAESTGKTTLSLQLAQTLDWTWIPEYARPYLESQPSPEVTTARMEAIWKGQALLQEMSLFSKEEGNASSIQDTDLFSTLGYWNFWDGQVPSLLEEDAQDSASDLYIITPSNIPFEEDPLRFGGDVRESNDQYWIDLCEKYELNYIVLTSSDRQKRLVEALDLVASL